MERNSFKKGLGQVQVKDLAEVKAKLLESARTMQACIEKCCHANGILPGGLDLKRRAPELYQKLLAKKKPATYEHTNSMAWLNMYAIAVNEENAAGGRVVTAPTNGAAGIIPAVLAYYLNFYPELPSPYIIHTCRLG